MIRFYYFGIYSNNFDPAYDCLMVDEKLLIDCRRKNFDRDGFSRKWPNVVCMSDSIIKKIDKLCTIIQDLNSFLRLQRRSSS
jgi:hypothetical protein